ncbi:Alpha/Beta hydrolase protein [Talaromyces proteolyticus]|uniref:Alpha/Beta hydrolase protein n=1 Tax=Talaromyces proteolyticus TaxID=1131652 RepID=A0AAD4KKB8_9EURO|nr:Alpha/Beta hydrolase protein [Talaromyces proteolyticus]KAH8694275.1 Alpha/Beta hydrolase protein [Talaromyces proteolyticus]
MSSIQPDQTITYKKIGSLQIPMDIYLPKSAKNAPVLLWFHGGGLLQGRRDLLAPHMRNGVQTYGYVCISADYRLAPQATVDEIFEDVKDCISFIRDELPTRLGEGVMDPTRLAVSGSSAGGFLTLLAGLYIEPKPQVIIPIYPITDPLGVFFTNSQPAPNGRYSASQEEMADYLDIKAPPMANCGKVPGDPRSHMYVYMLRCANLAKLWGVPDDKSAAPYRISRRIYEYGLPPTYILHGDVDTAVSVEQSDEVAGAMVGLGLTVEYERPHGEDHFLDNGEDYQNNALYSFMMRHL